MYRNPKILGRRQKPAGHIGDSFHAVTHALHYLVDFF
jgi:hypothetical protein